MDKSICLLTSDAVSAADYYTEKMGFRSVRENIVSQQRAECLYGIARGCFVVSLVRRSLKIEILQPLLSRSSGCGLQGKLLDGAA